ncbi:MAG: N-acetylmuramoyl-L-alanine amidase, partial [Calditrichaceae bacterium]
MKPEYLNPKEHVYGGLFSAIIKHGFFHRLLQCMIITVLFACQPEWVKKGVKYDYSQMDDLTRDVHENTEAFLYQIQKSKEPFYIPVQTKIQSIRVDEQADYFEVEFTKPLSYIALREENVREFYTKFKEYLSRPYNKYKFTLKCLGYPLQELVPNFYRSDTARYDQQRIPDEQPETRIPVVSQVGQERYLKALTGMNIAVWPSHGWYYNYSIKRWEWQRPRFFQTVEDLLSVSFTTPYLIPMLENAGALVFTPRERDIQINEVVVDNDGSSDADCIYREWSKDLSNTWENDRQGFGFRPEPLTGNQNPFNFGTSRYILSDTVLSAGAEWIPVIPSTGYYSVYIAFNSRENSSDEVNYSVYHSGGKTTFKINQRIGGRTWIYLGTFKFRKGNHPDSGRVEITNAGKAAGQTISADAIRFGGGQGSVARAGQPSGRPRFTEAGKYWLQYAGFPDSLVHAVNGDSNDYVNDYKSRPEFANYLNGAPCGPNYDRENNGLGIPVDLALALHTDAGTNEQDDLIGTMVIYSIFDVDSQKVFPNGISRLANRDLADIVQTQIVSDVKNLYTYLWPRRLMKEAWYSEAARPNMPSVIIELLSHQNFTDTRLALDPLFRFNVSRAIYKGILKFLTNRYGRKYVVQPLPVDHLRAEIGADGSIYVNWQPVPDVLEPTAMPTSFQVFIRQDSGDFDNGHRVFTNNFILKDPKSDMVYNFRV